VRGDYREGTYGTMSPKRIVEVYVNEYEPWYGVLVSDVKSVESARRYVRRETAHELPLRYLGVRVEPINNEDGRPGRRRRFHVFTDEPA
jgi:hypothetical protein